MDPQRFDRWSKAIAGSLTRREAVGGVGVAGLFAALMPWRGSRAVSAQADPTTCIYAFEAGIEVGRADGPSRTRLISGELRLAIDEDGAIDEGRLAVEDGEEADVVGPDALRMFRMVDRFAQIFLNGRRDIDEMLIANKVV